jgi:hypothetical protein
MTRGRDRQGALHEDAASVLDALSLGIDHRGRNFGFAGMLRRADAGYCACRDTISTGSQRQERNDRSDHFTLADTGKPGPNPAPLASIRFLLRASNW